MKTLTRLTVLAVALVMVMSLVPAALFAQDEPVTLNYANWNVGTEEENNIQRQLVAAYMEANPNVTIEFVDMSGDGGWDEKLTNLAARGELPDVFMANNAPLYVQNGWAADLSALVEASPDWANVPQAAKDAVTYNGVVRGVPTALFVMGYFANQDLFEAANLDAPAYGVSVDDFLSSTTSLTDVAQGVLGLDEAEFIVGWYPSTQDSALKWFGFDGEHMSYNSDAFKAAVTAANELLPNTWQGLTDADKPNFASQGPWELFLNQESGVRWDGGWAIPSLSQSATFNWDFVGIPGGNQALVTDILTVSAESENLEAAYDFAQWMSISSAGYANEIELATAAGVAPTRMPVAVSPESIDQYLGVVGDRPGLRQAMENMGNSLVESLAKIVPGYIQARWEGKPGIDVGDQTDVNIAGIIAAAINGTFKFEDYSAQLQDFANGILDEANAAMEAQ